MGDNVQFGPKEAPPVSMPWPWLEEGDQGRRKSQGLKGYSTALFFSRKPEMNIYLMKCPWVNLPMTSVLEQITSFWVSSSKGWSFSVFKSKFCLFFNSNAFAIKAWRHEGCHRRYVSRRRPTQLHQPLLTCRKIFQELDVDVLSPPCHRKQKLCSSIPNNISYKQNIRIRFLWNSYKSPLIQTSPDRWDFLIMTPLLLLSTFTR